MEVLLCKASTAVTWAELPDLTCQQGFFQITRGQIMTANSSLEAKLPQLKSCSTILPVVNSLFPKKI